MIEELETFLAVAEYRNFTRAAQKRNISQPTASVQIKKLEEFFGASLIERTAKHKNVALTSAGKILLQSAGNICAEIEYAKAAIGGWQEKLEGVLRIGASQTIGEYFLPEYLGRFTKKYSKLEPEIIIGNTKHIVNLLLNGEIDVGLVEGEVQESGINAEAFYRDRLVVIAAAGYEAGGNMRWIIREEGSASREQWESFVRESNININRRPVIFNTNFAVKEAVKNNLGCALISEHIAAQAQRAGEVSIADSYPAARRDFYCLTLHSRAERRAVTVFKEDLHENFAKNEGNKNKNED